MPSPSGVLAFSKIVGTGNDFIFVDARERWAPAFAGVTRPELARRVCDRHFGAGADGLVIVESTEDADVFRWDFYNSDGSVAEMCGNATRCMGRWAERYLDRSRVTFETLAGSVTAEVGDGDIVSRLEFVKPTFQSVEIAAGGKREAVLVNTGVPHMVLEVDDIAKASESQADIQALRHHPAAGDRGANVTFLQRLTDDRFSTISFERGVEDFTLSCGTGVLAAAAVGLQKTFKRQARVITPGGELSVSFGESWSGASLSGPAVFLFEAYLSEEVVR